MQSCTFICASIVPSNGPDTVKQVLMLLWLLSLCTLINFKYGLQGGRIERGTALTSYAQDNCGVTARLRAPGVEEGKEETLRATWICGCDGTRSPVRTGAGIKFVGATYKELVRAAGAAVVCSLRDSHMGPCVLAATPAVTGAAAAPTGCNVPRLSLAHWCGVQGVLCK